MKKVFQSTLIIIFVFGLYHGVLHVHKEYTRDYFIYVGEILAIGGDIVAEKSEPYVDLVAEKIDTAMSYTTNQVAAVSVAVADILEREQEQKTVIAYEEEFDEGLYLNNSFGMLDISSDAYLVTDIESGRVLLEKDADEVYPIASLSKLMTALVTVEDLDQSIVTTISNRAVGTEGYAGNLVAGDEFEVKDLLYPLLLESSNDAAEALAEVYNRAYFLRIMNEKAQELGLVDTKFSDPSGLSEDNVSTARELLELSKYINENEREIFDITMLPYKELGEYTWYSNSSFIKDDRYIGSKNGYTDEAEKTLILTYKVSFDGYERPINIILLHGTDSKGDVEKILKYLENLEYLDVEVVS